MRRTTIQATIALVLLLAAPTAGAQQGSWEVGPDQATSIDGTFTSLAELLTELCTRAKVELRAYDAPDRPLTATVTKRPLAEVLERVLSQENYLVGVRGGDSPQSPLRVVWIRVIGAKNPELAASPRGIAVPSDFGSTEFDAERPTDRSRAQEAVAKSLLADEARVRQLLEADPEAIAQSLRQYPHIDALLGKLRAEQEHPEVAAHLDAVIAALTAAKKGD